MDIGASLLALSASYSIQTLHASITLSTLTFIYNELGLAAGHWLIRNTVNSLGFVTFEVGACLVASTPCTYFAGDFSEY